MPYTEIMKPNAITTLKPKELAAFLEKKGWTQHEFAEALNKEFGTHHRRQDVNKWVQGHRRVPATVAVWVNMKRGKRAA